MAAYDFFFNRKASAVATDELEDPWGSAWDDLVHWLAASQMPVLFATLLLSYGVFLCADFAPRSTYFCSSSSDQIALVITLQWAGVFLDAAILILLWRVLSWSKTTKVRLQKLSGILASASAAAGLLCLSIRIFQARFEATGRPFSRLDSIFIFDVLSSGTICAVAAVSATLWMCESAPLPLAATTTFICGTVSAFHEILLSGSYEQTSKYLPLVVLQIVTTSFALFTYAAGMRWIFYIPRLLLMLLLMTLLVTGMFIAVLKNPLLNQNLVDEFVYKNRIEADRWLRHATISTTLHLAVSEYKDRHHGRDPPANFDQWYDFAMKRDSVIIDKFDQINTDILPFWGMKALKIREGLEIVKLLPDVGIISVVGGKASHNQPSDSSHKLILDDTVSLISSFTQYLPDLEFVINLRERPRVLVAWDNIHRLTQTGSKPSSKSGKAPPQPRGRRDAQHSGTVQSVVDRGTEISPGTMPHMAAQDFRHLQTLACPPGSKARASVIWNVRDHCASCSNPHSQGQILRDWEYSLEPCHQPDIFNLHDFHTIPHQLDLHQELLPIFSRSKTSSFNDILMPLTRSDVDEKADEASFDSKENRLFWQQEPQAQLATHDSLHGGHRNRLVRLINNATGFDKQSMLLDTKAGKEIRYGYEEVGTRDINKLFAADISYASPSGPCDSPNCQLVVQERFPLKARAENPVATNRYIMVLDTSDGPSPDTLAILRSNSVPFISSIFREWFTERLMPWTHFVPIDLRYHGLHSTLAYFEGLKGKGKINGRESTMESKTADARWIAEQGKKWAGKAVRREDMEVYMFRLLLEWGRVTSEGRDTSGFTLRDG